MNKWNNNNKNPLEMGPCDQEAGDEEVRWGIIKMIMKWTECGQNLRPVACGEDISVPLLPLSHAAPECAVHIKILYQQLHGGT